MSIDIASLVFEIDSTSADAADKSLEKLIATSDRLDASARRVKTATEMAGIGINGSSSATERATKSATQHAQALGAYERAQERAARAADVMVRRVNAIEKAVNPASVSVINLAERTATLDKALASGAISAERYARVMADSQNVSMKGAQYVDRIGGAAKLTSRELMNLSFQANDVFTSMLTARGAGDVLRILGQQSGQVGQIFQEAGTRGVGFGAAIKGIAESAGGLLLKFAPIGLVIGVAAAAFGLFEREVDKSSKHATTWGDTWKATVHVVGEAIMKGPIGTAIAWMGKAWSGAMDTITTVTFQTFARVTAFTSASYKTIVANWGNLPGAFEAIFISAANAGVKAVAWMVNGNIKLLNKLLDAWSALGPVKVHAPEIDFSGLMLKPSQNAAKAAADLKSFYEKDLASIEATAKGFVRKIAAQSDKEWEARQKATNAATDHEKASRADKDAVDDLTLAMLAFNAAAEDRNRLAAQFAAFKPKTINDPMAIAEASKVMASAESLNRYADELDQLAAHTQSAAQSMADAFGPVGAAIGDLASVLMDYDAKQADVAARREDERARMMAVLADEEKRGAGWQKAKLDYAASEKMADRELANARIRHYGDMATAAKGFFKEGTVGYSVMGATEKAFRLIEFAMSAKSIAVKAFETAAKIGLFGAEATAAAGAGAAAIFAAMGPFAFPVVAAMVATLAGLGVKLSGGASGVVPGATDMASRQAVQGAGSVLGDPTAKSASLENAMAHAEAYQNRDLEYSNTMVKSLRSIDGNMGALAAAIAQTLGASGALSTDGLNLGTTTSRGSTMASLGGAAGGGIAGGLVGGLAGGALISGSLGAFGAGLIGASLGGAGVALGSLLGPIGAIAGAVLGPLLFSAKQTRTLQDQGLQFGAQTLGGITAGGVNGQTYQQVLIETQKKFLGMTYSTKNTSATTTASLDADLAKQITDVIKSLREGVLSAAGILGVTGAEATLDAFTVNLGKLSFKDMKGDEIQAALNGIFGKLGDDLAATAIPALTDLQKVGEGAFETLVRVARQYQVVDTSLQSIGMTFGAIGVASLAARERLVDLSGGLDAFTEGTSFFAENFLSEAERLAPVQKAVTAELARLGLAADLTRDQFKSVVLGLDLTSEAGASMYAALINVAPAFDKVTTAAEAAAEIAAEAAAKMAEEVNAAAEVMFKRQIEAIGLVGEALDKAMSYDRRARYAEQAAESEKALKATEAATEAQTKLAETSMAAAKAALLAGDGLSALSEHMKVSADLARLAQQTNAAGSFSAGTFNAAYAGIQSRAALPLMQEASLNALRLENATKAVTDLMGVYLAPRSRELGGQTVGPVGDGLGIASIMARQGEALASFTALQDQWFAGIIKGQEATDLFAEAAEDAGAAITRAGLDSLGLYFRDITTATAELNAQAALAAEPISQVAQAVGRLTSIADVFTMSANAALGAGLTPDVEKAALIAQSAAIASQAMITADAAKIAEKIAGDAAFSALSKAGIRDAAMLLDGLKGNDARSFEAAFLRINNALVTGAVNQEQYQVLFGAAINTFEGLDEKVAATAQTFADLRLSAQKLAADLRMDAGINPAGAAGAFAASQDRYEGLFSSVLGGNVGAFSDFASTAQAMLSNARSTFATGLEYDRLFGRTLNDVDQLATLPTPQAHEDRMESLAAENNAELKALKATVQALLEEQQRSNRDQNKNGRLQTETLRQTVAPDSGTA